MGQVETGRENLTWAEMIKINNSWKATGRGHTGHWDNADCRM